MYCDKFGQDGLSVSTIYRFPRQHAVAMLHAKTCLCQMCEHGLAHCESKALLLQLHARCVKQRGGAEAADASPPSAAAQTASADAQTAHIDTPPFSAPAAASAVALDARVIAHSTDVELDSRTPPAQAAEPVPSAISNWTDASAASGSGYGSFQYLRTLTDRAGR